MSVTATQIFDFLDQQETFVIERHEYYSHAFSVLRRSVRQIVFRLYDADDHGSQSISEALSSLLSGWLTIPIKFNNSMALSIREILGESVRVRSQWGEDIYMLYEAAIKAVDELPHENPMRLTLCNVIKEYRSKGKTIRIYCHRMAKEHFKSLGEPSDNLVRDDIFLHTVRDYRESEPFDILIKAGPLRSRGWGAAPDALISAPRFSTLVQLVWDGCANEMEFGYDPATILMNNLSLETLTQPIDPNIMGTNVGWVTITNHYGEMQARVNDYTTDEDELKEFRECQVLGYRHATLIRISESQGIFYPPLSKVLSFDPAPENNAPIDLRLLSESLSEGMFIILPSMGDIDLGEIAKGEGRYSPIWKKRLQEELHRDAQGLCNALRAKGIELRSLEQCLENWAKPSDTVIHAPKQSKDFQALISELAIVDPEVPTGFPWWQLAWDEVRQSRGEAIQTGREEHDVIEEYLMQNLNSMRPLIRENARNGEAFKMKIPERSGMRGEIHFYKVQEIESSFYIPEKELKLIHNLDQIEQWRN